MSGIAGARLGEERYEEKKIKLWHCAVEESKEFIII